MWGEHLLAHRRNSYLQAPPSFVGIGVTPEELEREETSILNSLLSHQQNSADAIDEDDFVESIMRNSYWDSAGDIVVKELMYFDSVSPLSLSLE